MRTSARNQLAGTVAAVSIGAVMAEIQVNVDGVTIVSVITKESAEKLGLAEGVKASVIIKSTDVMIGVD